MKKQPASLDQAGGIRLFVGRFLEDPGAPASINDLVVSMREHWGPEGPDNSRAEPLSKELAALIEQGRWEPALKAALLQLMRGPWPVNVLAALCTICERLGHIDAAVAFGELVVGTNPKDSAARIRKARLLDRGGHVADAVDAWSGIVDSDPRDLDSVKALAGALIAESRLDCGLDYDAAEARRRSGARSRGPMESLRLGAESVVMDEELFLSQDTSLSLVERLRQGFRQHPEVVEIAQRLAYVLMSKGEDVEAEATLTTSRMETNRDPRIVEALENVQILRRQKAVKVAQANLKRAPDSTKAQAALANAEKSLDKIQTEICVSRWQRDPTRPILRLDLGRQLQRLGKFAEAEAHLAAAANEAGCRAEACFALGECTFARGRVVEAMTHFRNAADSAHGVEQWPMRRDSLMAAARIASSVRMHRLAGRYLRQILSADPADTEAAQAAIVARQAAATGPGVVEPVADSA